MKEGKCAIERINSMHKPKKVNEVQQHILHINIFTDGACSGNPGAGGWAALILIKNHTNGNKDKVVVKGGEKHTTNNRMELTAVIEALRFVYKNLFHNFICDVRVHSDSSYVVESVNNQSLLNWQNNGWKTTRGTDVINKDLWTKLAKLDDLLSVDFIKVKGHADNKFNNYVDKVAVEECQKYKKVLNKL
jgi:ribonuclease HI